MNGTFLKIHLKVATTTEDDTTPETDKVSWSVELSCHVYVPDFTPKASITSLPELTDVKTSLLPTIKL